MNLARLFSAYRILERQIARERVRHRVEVSRLKRELVEWQNRVLTQAHIKPFPIPGEIPKPTPTPINRPPIGISDKRAQMARNEQSQPNNNPTAEQILGAAARVAK